MQSLKRSSNVANEEYSDCCLERPESAFYSWKRFKTCLKGRFKNSPTFRFTDKRKLRALSVKATQVVGGTLTSAAQWQRCQRRLSDFQNKAVLKGSIPIVYDIILLVLLIFSTVSVFFKEHTKGQN